MMVECTRDWLPRAKFGLHSTPVIYGERPRGRLDIIRDRWNSQPLQVEQPEFGWAWSWWESMIRYLKVMLWTGVLEYRRSRHQAQRIPVKSACWYHTWGGTASERETIQSHIVIHSETKVLGISQLNSRAKEWKMKDAGKDSFRSFYAERRIFLDGD